MYTKHKDLFKSRPGCQVALSLEGGPSHSFTLTRNWSWNQFGELLMTKALELFNASENTNILLRDFEIKIKAQGKTVVSEGAISQTTYRNGVHAETVMILYLDDHVVMFSYDTPDGKIGPDGVKAYVKPINRILFLAENGTELV
jgi:hypothetical protein